MRELDRAEEDHSSQASDRRPRLLLHRYVRGLDLRKGSNGTASGPLSRVSGRRRSPKRKLPAATELVDPTTGWYRRWYFLARLEDDLERAQWFGQELSVLYIHLPPAPGGRPDEAQEHLRQRLQRVSAEALRLCDVSGVISDEELVAYLPQTGMAGAVAVAAKLRGLLEPFQPVIGVTVFPQDGLTVDSLIEGARRTASTEGKIVNLEEYRTRRRLRALLS